LYLLNRVFESVYKVIYIINILNTFNNGYFISHNDKTFPFFVTMLYYSKTYVKHNMYHQSNNSTRIFWLCVTFTYIKTRFACREADKTRLNESLLLFCTPDLNNLCCAIDLYYFVAIGFF